MDGQRYDIDFDISEDKTIDLEIEESRSLEMGLEETFVEKHYAEVLPATTTTIGGIIVGENLSITEEGVLSVNVANAAEEDNTRPITSAAVFAEVGNINVLLSTI